VYNAAIINMTPSGTMVVSNVQADPQMRNTKSAPFDFNLAIGSPAVSAGLTDPDVPVDIDGRSRPAGAYDLGAHQSSSVAPADIATPVATPMGRSDTSGVREPRVGI
jgi:hypothetical protein